MEILVLTAQPISGQVYRTLPALELLPHTVRVAGYEDLELLPGAGSDLVLVDARRMLAAARNVCRAMRQTGVRIPMVAVVEEAGLVAISADWGLDDVILATAGPTEVEARLRLTVTRLAATAGGAATSLISSGALVIDPDTYAAKLKGNPLDLTYKEFELLKFLAQHPGRVFTREQLLQEVWGYDYFGGPRTVDVHVRRLRAKLGSEYESMIATVRQVGYKLVLPPRAKTQALVDELETLLV